MRTITIQNWIRRTICEAKRPAVSFIIQFNSGLNDFYRHTQTSNIQIKHLINFCICLGSNPLSLENISLFCNMLMALEMSRKHGRKSLSAQLRAPVRGYWDTLGHVVTIHFICWMGWLQGMSHAAGESFIVQSDYSNTLGSSNRVWRCALSHYLWSLTQYRFLSLFKVMNVRYPFLLIVDIPYTQVLVHPNLQAVCLLNVWWVRCWCPRLSPCNCSEALHQSLGFNQLRPQLWSSKF